MAAYVSRQIRILVRGFQRRYRKLLILTYKNFWNGKSIAHTATCLCIPDLLIEIFSCTRKNVSIATVHDTDWCESTAISVCRNTNDHRTRLWFKGLVEQTSVPSEDVVPIMRVLCRPLSCSYNSVHIDGAWCSPNIRSEESHGTQTWGDYGCQLIETDMMDGFERMNRTRGHNAVYVIDYGDMTTGTGPSVCSDILGINSYQSPVYTAV